METDEDEPRGTKRAADGSEILPPPVSRRIKPLDLDVVNKIAAGEIIVAPVNALKELIENAVDAGSTQIEILAKDGGLKLLQITDNGHGIRRDDLAILCERFTTSKLKTFEDLSSIGTYGFRGEALASISHIAHLTVTTRTNDSNCAWRAYYDSGKLAAAKAGQESDPKPTAGRVGTQITVEDLFYNNIARRRAFRSGSEEYAKILDMVGRYAVHCSGVAVSCKKHGDSSVSMSTSSTSTTIDRIRQIHGSGVANELINFASLDDKYSFKADCWATNANYSVKKTSLLLFINHRAVESSSIKKGLEQTYSTFLPKGGHPFVYLSLEIEPSRVDVNVHPTKREVNFLFEDEIVIKLCGDLKEALAAVDKSRMFLVQSVLSGPRQTDELRTPANKTQVVDSTPSAQRSRKPYENNLVRTDSKARKITSMFTLSRQESGLFEHEDNLGPIYEENDKEVYNCRLTSVKELKAEVREDVHKELTEAFTSHTWVGVVDEGRRLVAIQAGVKLYIVNYGVICQEYFYQVGLTDFGNFGQIRFDPPIDIREVIELAAKYDAEQNTDGDTAMGEVDDAVEKATDLLIASAAMLREYFSFIVTEDGKLETLPLLVKGYTPSISKLPRFLLRLTTEVDWTNEKDCFRTFLHELARFYVPESLPPPPSGDLEKSATTEDPQVTARRQHMHTALEMILFPAFRTSLVATKSLLTGVTEVANLRQLYRVFERC